MDMRCGINTLSLQTQQGFKCEPLYISRWGALFGFGVLVGRGHAYGALIKVWTCLTSVPVFREPCSP